MCGCGCTRHIRKQRPRTSASSQHNPPLSCLHALLPSPPPPQLHLAHPPPHLTHATPNPTAPPCLCRRPVIFVTLPNPSGPCPSCLPPLVPLHVHLKCPATGVHIHHRHPAGRALQAGGAHPSLHHARYQRRHWPVPRGKSPASLRHLSALARLAASCLPARVPCLTACLPSPPHPACPSREADRPRSFPPPPPAAVHWFPGV